jgi:hypothetical protein
MRNCRKNSSIICRRWVCMILTFCSNVYALKQGNDNLFGQFCSNLCVSSLYMSVKKLHVMKSFSLEKSALFFVYTWHVNIGGANTHIYINGWWCLKCWYGPRSSCLRSIWLLKSSGLDAYCVTGFDSVQKWEVLLISAKSKCADLYVVLLNSPESLSSFLMCMWCPQCLWCGFWQLIGKCT